MIALLLYVCFGAGLALGLVIRFRQTNAAEDCAYLNRLARGLGE